MICLADCLEDSWNVKMMPDSDVFMISVQATFNMAFEVLRCTILYHRIPNSPDFLSQ